MNKIDPEKKGKACSFTAFFVIKTELEITLIPTILTAKTVRCLVPKIRNSKPTSFIIKVKVFASTDFSKILACSAPLKFQLLEAIIQLLLKNLPHLRSH